mmetsp:Transcript_9782/g.29884  ORF Transcript_9782/g.29884 Transcript_9782/m.29884 type:complete len:622 (+) Transcript_9782:446-2311(+)
MAGQLVVSSRGWFGSRDTIVHAGEGPISTIANSGSLVAWANDVGVKVFEFAHNRRVSYIERVPGAPPPQLFKCHLQWSKESELIIGWADSIKIGVVRSRDGTSSSSKYMEVVAILHLDFYVCGVSAARLRRNEATGDWADDLLALAYVCDPADEEVYGLGGAPPGGAQRPELRLISRANEEIFCDSLPIDGFEDLRADDYVLNVDLTQCAASSPTDKASREGHLQFSLDRAAVVAASAASAAASAAVAVGSAAIAAASATGLRDASVGSQERLEGAHASLQRSAQAHAVGDNQPMSAAREPTDDLPYFVGFVMAPRDIVVARSVNRDDQIGWLLSHGCFEAALELVRRHHHFLIKYSALIVAEAYAEATLAEHVSPREELVGLDGQPSTDPTQADSASDGDAGGHLASLAKVARVLAAQLGADSARWMRWIGAFGRAGCVRLLAPLLPVRPPLAAATGDTGNADPAETPYEIALSMLMNEAPDEALILLRQWPPVLWREPSVRCAATAALSAAAVVLDSGSNGAARPAGPSVALTEALALLACRRGDADAALALLLELPPPHSLAAFDVVQSAGGLDAARSRVAQLGEVSWSRMRRILLDEAESALAPVDVVPQLQSARCE